MGVTTELRRALKAQFYPAIERAGFVADVRDQPRSIVFRRPTGRVVQMFEIQWEKYGKPRFALRFGTCSASGLSIGGTVHAPDIVFPSWCPDAGALQPGSGATSRSWFRQDRPWLQRLLGKSPLREPTEVVAEALALYPELEQYWSTGQVGRHMRLWNLQAPKALHNAV